MSCIITSNCISCGDCKPECPVGAISESDPYYEINTSVCNDCSGHYQQPHCMEVCTEGAIQHVDD